MSFAKSRWFGAGCLAMVIAAGCGSDSTPIPDAGVDAPVSLVDAADVAMPSRLDGDADVIAPDAADVGVIDVGDASADGTPDAKDAPALVISGPSSLGTVELGYGGTPLTFVVRNTSDAASGTLSVSTSSSEFVIAADKCTGKNLAPSDTCVVDIAFHPVSAGKKSALLIVNGTSTAQLALAGTVSAGEAVLTVSPTTWDFGAVPLGAASTSKTFTVTNDSVAALATPTVTIGGAAAASFIATSACNVPLAVNGSCTVTVTFKPTLISATLAASLRVTSGERATSASLSGTGLPSVDIQIPFGPANDCSQVLVPAAGTHLNYLDVKCNNAADGLGFAPVVLADSTATSSSHTFTLTASDQVGTSELGPLSTSVSGDAAGDFSVTGNSCADQVLKGQTCSVDVKFAPTAVGFRSAQLWLSIGDARKATGLVAISRPLFQLFPLGNATHAITLPTAAIPVNGLDFGNQAVGMPGEIFTFRAQVWGSTANSRVNPLSFALTGDNAADFRIVDNGCTAAATKTVPYACDVTVQFYPQSSRAPKSATLVATGASGTAQLKLTGNATTP